MPDEILVENQDGIATVTFNRPSQRNAINYQMWLDLYRIALSLDSDPEVRVIVFTGAGDEAFSAGADIKDFDLYRNNSAQAKIYADAVDGALDAIEAVSKPTISMIKGYCLGGGCELTMATDLRIAAENARLGITAARLSIIIGYKEMRRLVELVGPGNASYVLLSARHIEASDALRMGLVNIGVPLEGIREYTYQLAREMSQLAPLSHQGHKRIIKKVLSDPSLQDLSYDEAQLPFTNFDSEDYHEGRKAFLERRRPTFRGR